MFSCLSLLKICSNFAAQNLFLSVAPSSLFNKCILWAYFKTSFNQKRHKDKHSTHIQMQPESVSEWDAIVFSMSLPYDLTEYMDCGKNVNIDDFVLCTFSLGNTHVFLYFGCFRRSLLFCFFTVHYPITASTCAQNMQAYLMNYLSLNHMIAATTEKKTLRMG